jgi:pimeloyl-ACP methyl ester carboxylesterase
VLVGNSMGGLISLMQAAEAPETVAALVLVDPAAPHPRRAPVEARVWGLFAGLLLPGLSEALVRASLRRSDPARVVAQVLALTCADPSRVDPEITAAHVRLAQDGLARPQTERALAMAARSLVAVLSRRRAFRQMVDRVTAPTLVVHGAKDRVVPLGASQLLVRQRPDWELAVLPDLGHVPMLEDPPSFLATELGHRSQNAPQTSRKPADHGSPRHSQHPVSRPLAVAPADLERGTPRRGVPPTAARSCLPRRRGGAG